METRPTIIVHCVKDVSIKNKIKKTREITSELTKLSCVLIVTFSGGNSLAEDEEGDSGETLACAGDAHKADVYTKSLFFYESRSYWDKKKRWFWRYSFR